MTTDRTREWSDDQRREEETPDPALVAAWAALKARRARAADPEAIDALERAVAEGASETDREAALARVLESGHADGLRFVHALREAARTATGTATTDASTDANTDAHTDVTRPLVPSARRSARWRSPVIGTVSIAAVAAVLILAVRGTGSDATDRQPLRGHDSTLALQLPISGARVQDSTMFSWKPIPDALSYLVHWYDRDGRELANQRVDAPRVVLLRERIPSPERLAFWQVEAILLDGRRLTSAMQPLNRP